jgi:hypothetical protein
MASEMKSRTGRTMNGRGTKTANRTRKGRNEGLPPDTRLRDRGLVVRFMMTPLC